MIFHLEFYNVEGEESTKLAYNQKWYVKQY